MGTRLTVDITYYDGDKSTISIELDAWDLSAEQFVDDLVRPAMLALGYSPETVDDALAGDVVA